MSNLETITTRLGTRYDKWKEFESKKNKSRDRFFQALTEQEAEKTLATQGVALPGPMDEDTARAYLKKWYPRWTISMLVIEHTTSIPEERVVKSAILEEDPALTTASYVNQHDERVYTRQVNNGSAQLDDELLKTNDPALWDEVTFTTPWDEIILWPLDRLSDDTLTRLQPYIYYDKPQVKLAAPRKAKPEELGE